jgi:ribosome-associated protein
MHKWQLPYHEIEFTYVRSRGPGGQNVNKTNSACQLRWNLLATQSLTPFELQRALHKLQNTLTTEGEILIRSDQHRDQEANKKACIDRLLSMIQRSLEVPKARRKTKPSRSSVKKRLKAKEVRSDIKNNRRKINDNSDQ